MSRSDDVVEELAADLQEHGLFEWLDLDVEVAEEAALTTTDLNVRYVRPATGDVRVEAEVVRAGSSIGVTECELTSAHRAEASSASRGSSDEPSEPDGSKRTVVATGGTTYRLFRDREFGGETT